MFFIAFDDSYEKFVCFLKKLTFPLAIFVAMTKVTTEE
jgi:hypothetical protein